MKQPFIPRCYRKGELARLYFPDAREGTAVRNLYNLVASCPPLVRELAETGYRSKSKYFTARQVRLIAQRLGDP